MQKIVLALALLLVANTFQWHVESNEMIQIINSMDTTWIAGHNSYFDGMTYEQIKRLMGTLKAPPSMIPEEKYRKQSEIEGLNLPTQFLPWQKWPQCDSIREIRDQSNCGSCWAFGTVEAISDRICITSGQTLQTRISSENLLSCCTGLLSCGFGCNGGHTEAAWNYFKDTGIVTGNLYEQDSYCQPYSFPPCDHHVEGQYPACEGESKTPQCSKQCNSQYEGSSYENDLHFGTDVYTLPNDEQQIMAELYENGSATASFEVYNDFLTYSGGVYQHVGGGLPIGGHAVKIMGWGVEGNTPFWLCANSWNADWGLKGFFKILRGHNECGIEKGIVAGQVKVQ